MPKHNLPRFPKINTSFDIWPVVKVYIPAIGILNVKIGEGNGLNIDNSGSPIDVEFLNGEKAQYSIKTLPRGRYELQVEYEVCIAQKHWKCLHTKAILFWWGHKYWGHLNLRFQAPYMGVFVDSNDEKALITAQELYDKMTFGSSK